MAATGHLYRLAGAALHELPGIALIVDGRGALAGCTRTCRAVVLPLQGDPKHFSMPPSMAALTCASVSGAAAAIDASAVATAPAKMAALTVDLVDMPHLSGWLLSARSSSARWAVRPGRPWCYISPAHNFVIGKGDGLSKLLPAT